MADQEPLGREYILHEEIGRGALAVVRRATSRLGGPPLAAKLLRPEYAGDRRVRDLLLREEAALRALDHTSIVGIHDLVVERGRLALVMDLVDGPNLRQHLAERGGTLPSGEATTIAAQAAAALAAAHAHGIVHLDLKPENILVVRGTYPPTIRISDFGVAALLLDTDRAGRSAVGGTLGYTAPEIQSGGPATTAADIYSLGVVLIELVEGVLPEPGDPDILRPGLPEPLQGLVRACLAADPQRRLSARALAVRLRAAGAALAGGSSARPRQPDPDSRPVWSGAGVGTGRPDRGTGTGPWDEPYTGDTRQAADPAPPGPRSTAGAGATGANDLGAGALGAAAPGAADAATTVAAMGSAGGAAAAADAATGNAVAGSAAAAGAAGGATAGGAAASGVTTRGAAAGGTAASGAAGEATVSGAAAHGATTGSTTAGGATTGRLGDSWPAPSWPEQGPGWAAAQRPAYGSREETGPRREVAPPVIAPPAEPPGPPAWWRRGPLLTLVAGGVVAALLVGLNVNAAADQRADRAAAIVATTPAPTPAASPATTAATEPQPASSAPPAAVPPPPATTAVASAPADRTRATFAGRVDGGGGTLAISLRDGVAIAYICDGKRIEEWLKGTAADGKLSLTGKKGAAITATFDAARARGTVTVDGKTYNFSIAIAKKPSGLYRAAARVRNAEVVGSWIVLPDGSQVGVLTEAGTPGPAPALDVAGRTTTVDGTAVTASTIDVDSGEGF